MSDASTGFWIGLFLGIFIAVSIVIVSIQYPSINIDVLGEKMCMEHNLTYDKYDLDKDYVPTIYCKNESLKKIEDGYLKLN